MRRQRQRRWRAATVAVAAMAALASVAGRPASAAVTGISPSSATVVQGGSATATVSVSKQGVSCLRIDTGDAPGVSASVQQSCSDETWTTRLSVATRPDTPPGTYRITVDDGEGSSAFSLRVNAPPPPTPPRTTTTKPPATTARPAPTTARTTTTAPPPPSTEPPTTEPPTTTEPPAPTTTTEPPPPNDGFVAIPTLIEHGLPKVGLFLPLSAYGYRTCFPLTKPCTAPDSPLVLLPARAHDIAWTPPAPDASTTPSTAPVAAPSLQPVGQRPDGAPGASYAVPYLDVATTGTATVATFTGTLDGRGHIVASTAAAPPALEPAPTPPPTDPDQRPGQAAEDFAVFDRPRLIDTTSLTEASPVLVTDGGRVLYGVRANPSWKQPKELIPFFQDGRVPFLVRAREGPAGILVGAEPGAKAEPGADIDALDLDNGRNRSSPLLPGAFLAVIAGLAVWTFRRRSRLRPR